MHGMPSRRTTSASRSKSETLSGVSSWDDIRVFLAVHRAGSLSAAAGPLKVTQPTCGRRLAALEHSLGVRLFDRMPDGLRITPDGRTLLDAAIRMERSAEDVSLRARVSDRGLEGVVRIATTELFACSFLVTALERVREKHPHIRAELVLSNTEVDLLRRDADIAVRFGPQGSRQKSPTLVARRLGDEPFLLYGSDTYLRRRGARVDLGDLADHDVVVFEGRHPAAEWCTKAFARSKVALSAPSMQVTGAAMAAGLGLGVLPRRAARLLPALRPLSPIVAHGTGWLILHPELQRTPRIRVVVDMLVAIYRAAPPRE
jgi:DNA-binding transcriptional LysR family regulator